MDNQLEIYTLGDFKVKNEGKIISPKEKINSKPWFLFKYLITERDKKLHSEVISNDLWPTNNIKNPKHSIANLVYRLRKKLKSSKNKEDTNYIINSNGNCFFNKDSSYWLDVEEFLDLTKKASRLKGNNPKKAMSIYKKALDIYKGDFLPEIPYQDWVIPYRNNYHWFFVETVLEYTKLLKKYDRYQEIERICEKALDIEAYEEELHLIYLEALLKLDEHAHARSHYQYANNLFNEDLDISSLPELEAFYDNNVKNSSLEKIRNKLKDRNNIKGAFICKNDIFRMIFELEERRAERINKPVFLSYIKIKEQNKIERYDYLIENILEKELRKGDVITRWDNNKYLMLLLDMSKTDVVKVIKRLRGEISEEIEIERNQIKSDYEVLK